MKAFFRFLRSTYGILCLMAIGVFVIPLVFPAAREIRCELRSTISTTGQTTLTRIESVPCPQ